MKQWTDEQAFRDAVSGAQSIKEICSKMGRAPGTGAYKYVKYYAELYGLELPMARGNPGTHARSAIPLEEILVKNSKYARGNLKRRLIAKGLLEDKCYECGRGPEWNGKNLVLQLEHVNGDGLDNRIENLSILCPNCHSQTKTFCRRKA
jgi:hypothetical protein